jgi:molecular chaperone IbpA
MNTLATLDRNRLTPYTVCFDSLFDRLFDTDFHTTSGGFPPYNIVKNDDYNYQIEMALAGYSKKDIDIELKEGTLSISSKKIEGDTNENTLIHRGISHKSFKRSFTLSDEMKVKGAKMENGMLYIALERIVPDHKKPQTIEVK